MKALSIRQPYVEQIFTGEKKIEYRTVKTNFRGKFYIYSSQKPAFGYEKDADGLPKGVIVGTVEIVDCLPVFDRTYETPAYHWVLANPKRLKKPLKPKGKPQPVWFNPF